MKLNGLHIASVTDIALSEAFDPSKEEKLSFIQMMIARQGKNPDEIIKRIRGFVDPQYAQSLGRKATFQRWLQSATVGNSRVGMSYGRRVKCTVLESEMREMLTEGFFSDVGDMILSKLRGLLGDEHKEHEIVAGALDRHPALAAVHRYASKAGQPIYDDESFWGLIDKLTSGKAAEVKRLAHGTFRRMLEDASKKTNILTECIMVEARLSQVMAEVGLDKDTIDGIMRQHGLNDEDYDLGRMKDALMRAKGRVEDAVKYMQELPGKAISAGAGALGKVAGGAMTGVKSAVDSKRMRDENMNFADHVVSIAAVLMDVREADAQTPQEVAQVVNQATQPNQANVADPSLVSTSELGVNV